MKHKWILLGLLILVALVGCTLTEAQGVDATQTGTATAVPSSLPAVIPTAIPDPVVAPDPAAARDAALSYLALQDDQRAALLGLAWREENVTPADLVGASTFRYTAEGWTVTVAFPLAAPQATIYRVTVADATGGFHWEGDVDATGQVSEVSTTQEPDPIAWQTYDNADYGFAFRYPSTWTLVENPAELGVPGGRAPRSIMLTRDTLRLLIQYKQVAEEVVVGPGGRGAGDIVDRGMVNFFGQETVKKALVFEGKVKSIFLGQPVQDLLFYIQLDNLAGPGVDYGSVDLGEELQAEFDQVLASFARTQAAQSWDAIGWLGYVVSNPPGAQFDDALVLSPEGAGQVGIAGSTPELEAEIVTLRDKPAPGHQAHFWGTLACNVPDVGGCQLLVTRLRYGANDTAPEPVEGWTGTLVSLEATRGEPPTTQFDDYFLLSGRFRVAYGIHSLDAGLQAELEALRDTGTPLRVWGALRCGVPDAFGSQIEVTRIEH